MSKENLINSSKELFLKYGVKSVSMDDIAKFLGISKKTIYNFVSNKSNLVLEVLKIIVKEEKETIEEINKQSVNAIDEMAAIARYILQFLRKMKPTLTYDLQKYHSESWSFVETEHLAFIEKVIRRNLTRGKIEGLYKSSLNEDILSKLYMNMARILVDEHAFPSSEYDRPMVYENFFHYHMGGVMNEKGVKELQKYMTKDNF